MSKGIKKSKSTRKVKAEAKKLLTKFVNQIAIEQYDEAIMVDREAVTVTKAEALARIMWKEALGWVERIDIIDKESGKVLGVKEKLHPPDKTYVTMLYDRMEGRVPTVEVKPTDSKPSVADRVSKEGTKRLNSIAKGK
jgi:hypothetical protein